MALLGLVLCAGIVVRKVVTEPSVSEAVVAYTFDWDDNILFMPSKIHMVRDGEPVALSTADFAEQRHDPELKPPNGNFDEAFIEFRDEGDPDRFATAAEAAVAAGGFGPSFAAWKTAILGAHPWAVITARGHSPENLRKGAKRVIDLTFSPAERREALAALRGKGFEGTDDEVLDAYLALCHFCGVSNPEFAADLAAWAGDELEAGALKPERAKQLALARFTAQVASSPGSSVGFSDDDEKNVEAADRHIAENLTIEFPDVKFVIYSTSSGAMEKRAVYLGGKRVCC